MDKVQKDKTLINVATKLANDSVMNDQRDNDSSEEK